MVRLGLYQSDASRTDIYRTEINVEVEAQISHRLRELSMVLAVKM
jgi:hypothetical protein